VLTDRKVRTQALTVSHAFHSPLMEPMLARFAEIAQEVGGGVPRLPVYSTVYGRLLAKSEAMDAAYWTRHVSAPVLFADAAAQLLEVNPAALVEVGPKPILGSLIRRIGPQPGRRAVHLAPKEDSGGRDLAGAIAELFRSGIDPQWSALYGAKDRQGSTSLVPYSFSTAHRYWSHKPVTVLQPAETSGRIDWQSHGDSAEWSGGSAAGSAGPLSQGSTGAVTTDDPVWDAVVSVVSQVGDYVPAQISARSRLYEDLGFDSVMAMELKDRLEARLSGLGALSTQELLPVMASAGDLAEFLRRKIAENAEASLGAD
jgi:acyl transferase domain-containing protein